MKILIVGSGGREHALAWKCAQSPKVSEVLVAPGNGGTATEPRVRNVDVAAEDIAGLVALAKAERVGLTIIGPEGPLVLGVVDAFAAARPALLRPAPGGRAARGLQGLHQGIPQAPRHSDRRLRHVHARDLRCRLGARSSARPIVVKASGLAAGKGVVIVDTAEEAIATAQSMFGGQFGVGRRPGGHRRIPAGRGSQLHRHGRRQEHPGRSRPRRITSGCRTRTPARTPAAWARIRPRPWSTRAMHERIMREVIEPTHPRARERRHAVHGLSVRRHHGASGRHAQRARVQLPLRRSGDAAHHDAAAAATSWSCARRRSITASTPCTPNGTRAPRSAWCSRRKVIRTACARATSSTGSTPRPNYPARCSTPAPGPEAARCSPTAAACCAPWGWGKRLGGAGAGVRARGCRSAGRACNAGGTSAIARWNGNSTRTR